ncbi:MAG TPA: formyltransferase [Burkholderiales bacterium]|nr:formyltransferase [Burkholderiales bacterium]
MTRAVVFAYHDVGCRCLEVLLARGIEVPLVVTHEDSPGENIWFGSVAALARSRGLPIATPEDANESSFVAKVRELRPDFIFSFYYRSMLRKELLSVAPGFNMHGSLLPKYRGRVPVNWAIVQGEIETGATLHEMVEKPDAGRIVDQEAVPILPDDQAVDVFRKVTGAAERVLVRSLPSLIAGTAVLRVQDLSKGSYFGGRKPEDGRIDWRESAKRIHDLVRAVAPPYPGAFTQIEGKRLRVLRTRTLPRRAPARPTAFLQVENDRVLAACVDGGSLELLETELDGKALSAQEFAHRIGARRVLLS